MDKISYRIIYLLTIPGAVLVANLAEANNKYIPAVSLVFNILTYGSLILIFATTALLIKGLLNNSEGSVILKDNELSVDKFVLLVANLYGLSILSSIAGILGSFCLS